MGKIIMPNGVEGDFVGETGEVSDGYHTFNELYDHRITLFIALCKRLEGEYNEVWRSWKHDDGKRWAGWFILGINTEQGEQITYHLPEARWEETDFADTLEKAPEFDGHTPEDVLERLKSL